MIKKIDNELQMSQKKIVYMGSAIVLALLLVFLLYEIAMIRYIDCMLSYGKVPAHLGIFTVAWVVLSVAGGIRSIFLSRQRWKIIYVEKRIQGPRWKPHNSKK